MSSESLIRKCKSCGADVLKTAPACPKCGAKQQKLTAVHWIGIVILALILIRVFSASDTTPPTASDAAAAKPESKLSKQSKKDQVRDLLNFDYTARKDEFGLTFKIDALVINSSDSDIKDVEIVCEHFANSGTRIDSNSRVIYELVPASERKSFKGFDMGLIHDQAVKTACRIEDFVVVPK